MNDGQLFRKLRLERGLTQEQLAKDITSRTALSSFELRETDISLPHAIKYLNRLNITLEEYEFMYRQKNPSKKHSFSQYLNGNDAHEAQANSKLLLEKYTESGDNYFFYLYIQNELLSKVKHGQSTSESYDTLATRVKNYLNKIETWGHFEIIMFSNCMYIFNSEYINFVLKNVLPLTEEYQETIYFTNTIVYLCQNGIGLGIHRQDSELIKTFKQKLYSLEENDHTCVSAILRLFFHSVDNFRKFGDKVELNQNLNNVWQLVTLLHQEKWEAMLKKYLSDNNITEV
ncbi:Rgg/GadR/MutR family transcriptional regulator [Lapidilactobacillus bayanensis]|uniref:Rgg/GadR/MutR family transcriptional regulator n=1 Tax=Lapidilactobacillus bayanensis TaxID=2485998 RepID=UPI000F77F5FB|nr:Rgg/GadR/MutR family transcriptional regulator [Lapidilactobacillus bayanensis]